MPEINLYMLYENIYQIDKNYIVVFYEDDGVLYKMFYNRKTTNMRMYKIKLTNIKEDLQKPLTEYKRIYNRISLINGIEIDYKIFVDEELKIFMDEQDYYIEDIYYHPMNPKRKSNEIYVTANNNIGVNEITSIFNIINETKVFKIFYNFSTKISDCYVYDFTNSESCVCNDISKYDRTTDYKIIFEPLVWYSLNIHKNIRWGELYFKNDMLEDVTSDSE